MINACGILHWYMTWEVNVKGFFVLSNIEADRTLLHSHLTVCFVFTATIKDFMILLTVITWLNQFGLHVVKYSFFPPLLELNIYKIRQKIRTVLLHYFKHFASLKHIVFLRFDLTKSWSHKSPPCDWFLSHVITGEYDQTYLYH